LVFKIRIEIYEKMFLNYNSHTFEKETDEMIIIKKEIQRSIITDDFEKLKEIFKKDKNLINLPGKEYGLKYRDKMYMYKGINEGHGEVYKHYFGANDTLKIYGQEEIYGEYIFLTPLQYAILQGDLALIRLLLTLKADPHAKDSIGLKSGLDLAKDSKNREILNMIINYRERDNNYTLEIYKKTGPMKKYFDYKIKIKGEEDIDIHESIIDLLDLRNIEEDLSYDSIILLKDFIYEDKVNLKNFKIDFIMEIFKFSKKVFLKILLF
jgi:hypothetical protein